MAGSNKTGKKSETKNEGMLRMTFREVSKLWLESKKDSVHRVRKTASSDGKVISQGTYGGRDKVTGLQVEEIPTKKHIRRVNYPAALDGYIRKFYKENICSCG